MEVKTQQTYILSCKRKITLEEAVEQIQKLVKIKVKYILEQSRKVQRGSRGIALLFL